MEKQDLSELIKAFDKVFDAQGEIQACGREKCANLINLMKKHSSEDVGDEASGYINEQTMKNEYLRLLRIYVRG